MTETNGPPNGWRRVKLKDFAELVNGFAFKPSHWKSEGLPIIRIQNLNDPSKPFNRCPETLPEKFLVERGDLLFAWSGTPGTSFGAHIWRGERAWLNQHIYKVKFDRERLDSRFLRLAINHNLQEYIRQAHGGAGLAHITKGRFEASEILIAPLELQRRIVAKIEELFSDLDAGVAALTRAQANLKRYRAAVLKAAVEGKLTAAWRAENPCTEPAPELLNRILAARRQKWEQQQLAKYTEKGQQPPKNWRDRYKEPARPNTESLPELPEAWCWARVDQIGDVQLGRQRSPKHHKGQHMRPYLRVANVFEDRIDVSDVMEMNFTPSEYEAYKLQRGDILLNEGQSMELVGRPAIYRDEVPGACFTNTLVRFRSSEGLDPAFALKAFLAYMKNGRFQRIATITVNIAHLGAARFSELEFPLPPLEEQREISREADRQLSTIRALETLIKANVMRTTRLRQSILSRAFAGRLVP
jgi:type I restriction enzyme S subunit